MNKIRLKALSLVRDFLPLCWRWTHFNYIAYGQRFFMDKRKEMPEILSSDMCRHTTLFMLELLAKTGDDSWKVAGGYCNHKDAPGVYGESGYWGQHWWLENGSMILDLTADQFGWESIVLVPVSDKRYVKAAELSKKKFVSRLYSTVGQWTGEAGSFWMQADPAYKKMKAGYAVLEASFVKAWPIESALKAA